MSSDPSPNDRIAYTTWKDIAQHFDRDVRTVQRWEKEEGLPVHRHIHQRKSSVYAYPEELQQWWRERGARLAATTPSPETKVVPQRNYRSIGWILAMSLLIVIALVRLVYVVATGAARKSAGGSSLVYVFLHDKTLAARDENGDIAWTYEFPQAPRYFIGAKIMPSEGGNSAAEVLAAISASSDSLHHLLLFSHEGKIRWQYAANESFQFGNQSFEAPWGLRSWGPFDIAGERKIVAALVHNTWWPSQLVMLDRAGHVDGRFVNSGWIVSVEFAEGPQGPLLLAGGASNSRNGGMLAVLDAKQISGSSPEKAGSPYECKSCAPGRPLKYFVFPRSELNIATGSTYNYAYAEAKGRQIVVNTKENEDPSAESVASGVYEFSTDFQLLRASYGDRYWDLHRKLELEGKIKHSKAQCPDRKGPRNYLAWDRQSGWKEIHPN